VRLARVGADQLHRDQVTEDDVPRGEDAPHPPLADEVEDLVPFSEHFAWVKVDVGVHELRNGRNAGSLKRFSLHGARRASIREP